MSATQFIIRQARIVGPGLPSVNHARGEISIQARHGDESSLSISMVAEEGSPLPTFWTRTWWWEGLTVSVSALTFTLTGQNVENAVDAIKRSNDFRHMMFVTDGFAHHIHKMRGVVYNS
jgi:hypothetical protein